MDTTKVKRMIGQCADIHELAQVVTAARARIETLRQRQYKTEIAEFWAGVKGLKPGTTVYCNATGTFMGGPLQRGDCGIVHAVQPRKKLLWLSINGEYHGFNPHNVRRYAIKPTRPDTAIGEDERRMANAAGEIFEKVLG